MAYKKPEIVAKSETKQSFVAGCPTNMPWVECHKGNVNKCFAGPLN